jgi:DNA polymerase-4
VDVADWLYHRRMEPPTRDSPEPTERPWEGRAVLHVDMDAFFTSVEQLDHPEWRGRPVVVGGSPDKRGVIAAASYEARSFGVRSAMPAAQAARLLPPDAVWTRGSFERYGEVSTAVFDLMREITPEVQAASIDEAYLDVTPGSHGEHPVAVARTIMAAVEGLGITCSVGVAATKTVAKIASDRDKPRGLTVVWPGEEAAFLGPLDVGLMPGIGPQTASRLRALGVRRLSDLAALDGETARQVLGNHGPSVALRARGIDSRPVRDRDPVKSVSNERTFSQDIRDPELVREALAGLSEQVASRLRGKDLRGRTVHLKLRFADFTTKTAQETLPGPIDSTAALSATVMRLLKAQWTPGVGIRLLGVGVSGFGDVPVQLDLLSGEAAAASERRGRVERTVDALRARFGDDSVRFGGRGAARDPRDKYGPAK